MESHNILFESTEIVKNKLKEIEKINIEALKQSQEEIRLLLNNLPKTKKIRTDYMHDTSQYHNNSFPVDHRIVK